jgi:glutathione synthase
MNFVFLMDPLSTVIVEKDTSFILMLGAHRRGHSVYFVGDGGIALKDGRLHFHAVSVVPQVDSQHPFLEKKKEILTPEKIDCVFIRSDPPFDYQYLVNTWLLDRLPGHIPVINSPSGIRQVNEKLWATQLK